MNAVLTMAELNRQLGIPGVARLSQGNSGLARVQITGLWGGREHPNVHFHYTPTYASWINQVECWFSILSRWALRGVSFTSPQQVREAIDRLVAAYNRNAGPFEWKKDVVHSSAPKYNYADLHN